MHLGIKSRIASSNITNDNIDAIVIHTILFVREDLFEPLEFDSSEVDGPLACFGLRPDVGGGFCSGFGPGKNGVACDGVPGGDGDAEGGNGAVLVLNGFPSLLHFRTKN